MDEKIKAKEPFKFYTRLDLFELTGLSAATLPELLEIIKKVPDSCVYYHTHRFLQQHQYLSPEPPNDFAYWVSEVLREDELGEKLASIDTVQYSRLPLLRDSIVKAIEGYLSGRPSSGLRHAGRDERFHFLKSVSFVMPTMYSAWDLAQFVEILRQISINSIYFHIFEARLRLEKRTNDFSNWMENSVGDAALAQKISKLDPYTYTLEELRKTIIAIIEKKIAG